MSSAAKKLRRAEQRVTTWQAIARQEPDRAISVRKAKKGLSRARRRLDKQVALEQQSDV